MGRAGHCEAPRTRRRRWAAVIEMLYRVATRCSVLRCVCSEGGGRRHAAVEAASYRGDPDAHGQGAHLRRPRRRPLPPPMPHSQPRRGSPHAHVCTGSGSAVALARAPNIRSPTRRDERCATWRGAGRARGAAVHQVAHELTRRAHAGRAPPAGDPDLRLLHHALRTAPRLGAPLPPGAGLTPATSASGLGHFLRPRRHRCWQTRSRRYATWARWRLSCAQLSRPSRLSHTRRARTLSTLSTRQIWSWGRCGTSGRCPFLSGFQGCAC